ncbi:hypothetical protein Anapl_06713 [Anas platyrhynchos]|uniref:Uncharacterized protein n=1 Tax=Anas platyrhynchos TaxID=8839 RepID=R0M275_ANAPL|nr:hypothetical protein Anapl_06713 [Anas platyrhynchos]
MNTGSYCFGQTQEDQVCGIFLKHHLPASSETTYSSGDNSLQTAEAIKLADREEHQLPLGAAEFPQDNFAQKKQQPIDPALDSSSVIELFPFPSLHCTRWETTGAEQFQVVDCTHLGQSLDPILKYSPQKYTARDEQAGHPAQQQPAGPPQLTENTAVPKSSKEKDTQESKKGIQNTFGLWKRFKSCSSFIG